MTAEFQALDVQTNMIPSVLNRNIKLTHILVIAHWVSPSMKETIIYKSVFQLSFC
jgi:hypothetical protein